MRILYASERPPYPVFLGGAARCAHHLIASLKEQGSAECLAVGSAEYAKSPWSYPAALDYAALGVRTVTAKHTGADIGGSDKVVCIDCGYPVQVLSGFPGAIDEVIEHFRPDVVWAQLEGALSVLTAARRQRVRGLLYVHDAEFDRSELLAADKLGAHIVCSSEFLALKAGSVVRRPVYVVYPASDWYFGANGDPDGFITMINPVGVKGIDTFLEVAHRMPHLRFLLVESWRLASSAVAALQARLQHLPNVRFQHRVSDMREIYRQTRLLLVPSVWEEGFGMVAVEAQSCGIPVIASARGGLPESVGDGGILIQDYLNVQAWLDAMHSILDDEVNYRVWSVRALQHARSPDFDADELARRFLAICALPTPGTGSSSNGSHSLLSGLERLPLVGRMMRKARR